MPSTLETQSLTGEPKISPLAGKPAPKELLVNVASSGKFSSDRTIAEYAAEIWEVEPCPVL